jgi:hypothetical protein
MMNPAQTRLNLRAGELHLMVAFTGVYLHQKNQSLYVTSTGSETFRDPLQNPFSSRLGNSKKLPPAVSARFYTQDIIFNES